MQLEEPVGHVHGKVSLITRSSRLGLVDVSHLGGVVDRDWHGPDGCEAVDVVAVVEHLRQATPFTAVDLKLREDEIMYDLQEAEPIQP